MINQKTYASISFFLLLACGGMFAKQSVEDIVIAVRGTASFEQLVKGEVSLSSWPDLASPTSLINKNDPTRARFESELFVTIMQKLKEFDDSNELDFESNRKAIMVYTSFLDETRGSRGYLNYLLRDSIRRLALSRIAFGILEDSGRTPNYKELLANVKLSEGTMSVFFAELMDKDEGLLEVNYTEQKELTVSKFLELCGSSRSDFEREYAFSSSAFSSKALFDTPSAEKMAYRFAYTDFIAESHLSALILFIEKGGELKDVDMSDSDRFNALMKKDVSKFSNASMGLRRFNVGHLQMFIRQFSSPENYGKDALACVVF
jgi:hypothetical protein